MWRSRKRLRSAVALRAVEHRREVGTERMTRRRQAEDEASGQRDAEGECHRHGR